MGEILNKEKSGERCSKEKLGKKVGQSERKDQSCTEYYFSGVTESGIEPCAAVARVLHD